MVTITREMVIMTREMVIITRGMVIITREVVIITREMVIITREMVIITRGTVIITRGMVIITQEMVLKAEYYVLNELKRAKAQHFCDLIDHGLIDDIKFIVMTLVGSSLGDLRKHDPTAQYHKLSLGCALSVGIKCLQAIEEIHGVGFLHRDIKPGNFAIGRVNVRQIYLLDFGMCRRYLDSSLQIRNPRKSVRFRGTVRYAAISCHLYRELCRKDDLESWLYQQVELTNGRLPWKNMTDLDEVVKCKACCREFIKELLGGCPSEYLSVMKNIDALGYYTNPNYAQIVKYLRLAIRRNNVNEYPYDWECKGENTPKNNTAKDKVK
ncbi:Tau-tubulin kinase 1 [Toxocara canis]|uniref:Tau-tubulin kinase 1 n=1 Tax=Toxocara canis TaxID=6265 RepID=A0A0B2VF03_TOXCA|nr:Tau-tubulin kinase 1 [Toxocara canis]